MGENIDENQPCSGPQQDEKTRHQQRVTFLARKGEESDTGDERAERGKTDQYLANGQKMSRDPL